MTLAVPWNRCHPNSTRQSAWLRGLLEMNVKTCFARPFRVLGTTVTGECDERDVTRLLISTQLACNGISVEIRKAEIQKHHVRAELTSNRDRFVARTGDLHLVPKHGKHIADGACRVGIVVHDQDATCLDTMVVCAIV